MPIALPQGYLLHSHFLPDFPYEKPDRHHLPRRCRASWKCGGVLEPRFPKGFAAYQSGDYATALREWTPLAKQGDAVAQYNLGVMYAQGQGVPQDYKTAVKWYRLAAEQGNADAQYNLGVMYDKDKVFHRTIRLQ